MTDEINELSGNLSIAEVLPVGTILAWTMKVEVNGPYSKEIPEGWLRCDGSIIPALCGQGRRQQTSTMTKGFSGEVHKIMAEYNT